MKKLGILFLGFFVFLMMSSSSYAQQASKKQLKMDVHSLVKVMELMKTNPELFQNPQAIQKLAELGKKLKKR